MAIAAATVLLYARRSIVAAPLAGHCYPQPRYLSDLPPSEIPAFTRSTPPSRHHLFNQRALDELVFDRFGFGALYRTTPAHLAAHALRAGLLGPRQQQQPASAGASAAAAAFVPSLPPLPFAWTGSGVVVDVGFSCVTVTPFHGWKPVAAGIRRCVR